MSIQGSINQFLGMGAIASQLPSGRDFKEKMGWKTKWPKMQKTEAKMGVDYKDPQINEQNKAAYEQAIINRKQLLKEGEKQIIKNPSEFNYKGQMKGREQLKRMEDAMNEWKSKATAQIQQNKTRRNFMDYLRKEPTSLGGTVDDLPANIQKEISSQIPKAKRKEIMDRYDRRVNNGKS